MSISAELFDRWVEALESGRYEQGDGQLHDAETDTYCCLGVLCDVAGFDLSAPRLERQGRPYGTHGGVLGLDLPAPLQHLNSIQRQELAGMNDDLIPFAEIAAYLRLHRDEFVIKEEVS